MQKPVLKKNKKQNQQNCIWKARNKVETYINNVLTLPRGHSTSLLSFNFLMWIVADPSDYSKSGTGPVVARMRNWW